MEHDSTEHVKTQTEQAQNHDLAPYKLKNLSVSYMIQ